MLQIFSNFFSVLYVLMILGTVLIILTDRQDSGRKISWILVIALVPFLGLLCYIVFGFNWRRAGFFQRRHKNFLKEFDERADGRIKDLLFGHSAFSVVYRCVAGPWPEWADADVCGGA